MRSDIASIQSLLGPMMKFATIRPPGKSVEDWGRFLTECDEAGISRVTDKGDFQTGLGFALYWRWRWHFYVVDQRLPFEAADALWNKYSGILPRRLTNARPDPTEAPRTPTTPDTEAEGDLYAHAVALGMFD
jgi:hypothetical protein